jgi:glycosidase
MGVETIWFMPLTPIASKNKKGSMGSYYACADYKGIDPEFGNEQEFRQLVNDAHSMGFKVIIDWVANHTGWDHVWTKKHPGYYKMDETTNDFKMASGMEDIIELDHDNPELRDAMVDAMKWWVNEFDIDGFRCDLAFWVPLAFWKEARPALDKIKPLFWLGEFDEMERPEYGEVFDASYSWKWMHKTEEFYKKGLPLKDLVQLLKHYDDLGPQCARSWFTSNHDENSWNGTEFEKYGEMAGALAVFSMTWDGIPLLYSGQELPNTKRLKFFDKDPIEWKAKLELEGFYTELLQLKKQHPALRAGDKNIRTLIVKTTAPKTIFAYLRTNDEVELLIVLNLSGTDQSFEIIDERLSKNFPQERSFDLKAWAYVLYDSRLKDRKFAK